MIVFLIAFYFYKEDVMGKRSLILCSMFVLIFAVAFTNANAADDWATKEECEARVKEAVKMINEQGFETVSEKINNRDEAFRWKDSYIFCVDMEGTMLAHPAAVLIGQNLMNMPDSDGKMFMPKIIDLAKKDGAGWVHYTSRRRATNEILTKNSFITTIADKKLIVGAGYFTPKE